MQLFIVDRALDNFKYCYLLFWVSKMVSRIVIYCFFTQLDGWKYSKWLNSSILPFERALILTNTSGQSGSGNNSNDGVLYAHSPKIQYWNLTYRYRLVSNIGQSLIVLSFCKDETAPAEWANIHRPEKWVLHRDNAFP